jgi:hypothetical protein
MFPSHSNENAVEEGKIKDEIGDAINNVNLLGMDESATGAMGIDVGPREFDPNKV